MTGSRRVSGNVKMALQDRRCDVWPLIKMYSKDRKRVIFSQEAKDFINNYSWRGNIRELISFVEYASTFEGGKVTREFVENFFEKTQILERSNSSYTEEQYNFAIEYGLPNLVNKLRQDIISDCLSKNNGNKAKTKRNLQISNDSLYSSKRKIKESEHVA